MRPETKQFLVNFYKQLREDVPTNSASGGAIAGLGVGPQGEPSKPLVDKILKRKNKNDKK